MKSATTMSWVDKELKKRTAASKPSTQPPAQVAAASAAERIAALWARITGANDALPPELRLRADATPPQAMAPGSMPPARAWLHGAQGAALGCTADGIRYFWPRPGKGRSHNFWIRWKAPSGYLLQQRHGASVTGPTFVERRFDEARVDRIVQCLVQGRRIKLGAVRKKRFWLF